MGSAEVEVMAGKDVTAEVICTLANVLVTVEFDELFKKSFNLRPLLWLIRQTKLEPALPLS